MKPLHVITGIAVIAGVVLFLQTAVHPPPAHARIDTALEKARMEDKYVMLVFTGSDWCCWCIKLDDEVLSRKEFKEYAGDHLVFIQADFPRDRSTQSEELIRQNEQLAREYGVTGFPMVFILGPDGRKIAQTGYRQGGVEAYVDHLEKLIASAQ